MITPQEAERRAHQHIEEYVAGALCSSPEEVAKVLMKLISVAGVAIATVSNKDDAVFRMRLCADIVAQVPASQMPRAEYIRMRPDTPGMGY